MAVRAVGAEGDHDVRPDAPDVRGDRLDRLADVGPIQRLVLVVEHGDVANAQHRGGGAQFLLADLPQTLGARMLGRVPMAPERPFWPRVAVTRNVSTPSAAYFASVPPTPSDSSSGWARTAIRRRRGGHAAEVYAG